MSTRELMRKIVCPFYKIEPLVPIAGKILDVGCGHGTFSEILAKKSPAREVLGIDPDIQRIKIAQKKARNISNLTFKYGYLDLTKKKQFECITILDILYLLPDKKRLELLIKTRNLLKKDGILILKVDSRDPKWLSSLLKLEEELMVKVFKITYSDLKKTHFLSQAQYRNLLNAAGFTILKEQIFKGTFPYLHPTFIAQVR